MNLWTGDQFGETFNSEQSQVDSLAALSGSDVAML
jgi:hypothetical protein